MAASHDRDDDRIDRRRFMAAGVGTAGAAALTFYWSEEFGDPSRRAQIEPTPPDMPGQALTDVQLQTAEAACARILPSGPNAPGAREVGAGRYLDAVIASGFPNARDVSMIVDGLDKLEQRARRMGAASFAAASPTQQDDAIRVFETFNRGGRYPGHRWLKLMVRFTLEAFLGDPVHGGNPSEIGWKWIGHKAPAFRPTTPDWRPTPKDDA